MGEHTVMNLWQYSKTFLKRPLKKNTKIGFQDRLSLNAGQKYCKTLPLEHSAKLSTFIKETLSDSRFLDDVSVDNRLTIELDSSS